MKSSEIILNPDSSIYHLRLKNGEVPSKVITVGDPDRLDSFLPYLDQVFFDRSSREFRCLRARVGQTELLLLSTGIGTDNVDVVFNELQLAYQWDLKKRQISDKDLAPLQVVRLGTSGALQDDVAIDSILMSKAAIGFDYLMHFYQWEGEYLSIPGLEDLPKPYLAHADAGLLKRFDSFADFQGYTLTANGFYGPQGRSVILNSRPQDFLETMRAYQYNGERITNLEMETAGIYGLGGALGMQCLSLSAILANRMNGTFSKNPAAVVDKLIRGALDIMSDKA